MRTKDWRRPRRRRAGPPRAKLWLGAIAALMLPGCATVDEILDPKPKTIVRYVVVAKNRGCQVFSDIASDPADKQRADGGAAIAGHKAAGAVYCGADWKRKPANSE